MAGLAAQPALLSAGTASSMFTCLTARNSRRVTPALFAIGSQSPCPEPTHLLRVCTVLGFMSLPIAAYGTPSDLGPGHVKLARCRRAALIFPQPRFVTILTVYYR
jgi:hypothetical protein